MIGPKIPLSKRAGKVFRRTPVYYCFRKSVSGSVRFTELRRNYRG